MNQEQINLNTSWGINSDIRRFDNEIPRYGDCNIPEPWYQPNIYTPIVREYYPLYLSNWNEKNKTEQAFKIVQKLIEKGRIKISIVKEFIEIVNEIVETL